MTEDEKISLIAKILKKQNVSLDCGKWCVISALNGNKLDELIEFISDNNNLSDEILFKWDIDNIPSDAEPYIAGTSDFMTEEEALEEERKFEEDEEEYLRILQEEKEQEESKRLFECYKGKYK